MIGKCSDSHLSVYIIERITSREAREAGKSATMENWVNNFQVKGEIINSIISETYCLFGMAYLRAISAYLIV